MRRSVPHQEDFDLVVIATGLYSDIPNMPDIPGREEFEGEVLHISQVKTRAPLEGKRVAVVGYGKSATDAALEAAAVAERGSHRLPRSALAGAAQPRRHPPFQMGHVEPD